MCSPTLSWLGACMVHTNLRVVAGTRMHMQALSLYRQAWRAMRAKPDQEQGALKQFIKDEFRKNKDVPRSNMMVGGGWWVRGWLCGRWVRGCSILASKGCLSPCVIKIV